MSLAINCPRCRGALRHSECGTESSNRITRLESQVKELEAQRDEAGRRYVEQVQECTDKDRRIAELEAELADWQNAAKMAQDEKCTANEVHCTCVPVLRSTIAFLHQDITRLREYLRNLEWEANQFTAMERGYCPVCGMFIRKGHAPDCWLAKELEGE